MIGVSTRHSTSTCLFNREKGCEGEESVTVCSFLGGFFPASIGSGVTSSLALAPQCILHGSYVPGYYCDHIIHINLYPQCFISCGNASLNSLQACVGCNFVSSQKILLLKKKAEVKSIISNIY